MTRDSPHPRTIPPQEVLEGLARIHPFVLVANADGTIEWMNERLRARFEDDSLPAFVPKREQLAALRDNLQSRVSSGTVHLDCEFRGSIVTVDKLIVGRAGRVDAEINAGVVEISGEVRGNIRAKTSVKILSGGRVLGNVETPTIAMEEGVVFEGSCTRPGQKAPQVAQQARVQKLAPAPVAQPKPQSPTVQVKPRTPVS